jgi:hypothetical protein
MMHDRKSLIAMMDMQMALAGVNHHVHSNLYPLEMDIHHVDLEEAQSMALLNRLVLSDPASDPIFICGDRMPNGRDFDRALALCPNVDFGLGDHPLLAEQDTKPKGSPLLLKLVERI